MSKPIGEVPKAPKMKPPPEQAAVAERVTQEYNAAKAATNTSVREATKSTAKMYEGIKSDTYVAETLAERAKAAPSVTREAGVKAAESYLAKKAGESGAKLAARAAGRGLGFAARRILPPVGVAMDVATTAQAGYEGAKAAQAHSDLTKTAKSLEKRGIQVETPSFNPLKAAYPGIFGEHPEVRVKEPEVGRGKPRKLGS